MGIKIESPKLTDRVKRTLEGGRRPSLCVKTIGGCRIGLLSPFYSAARGDVKSLVDNPSVLQLTALDYDRYCEQEKIGDKTVNPVIHFTARNFEDLLANLSRICDPGKVTGGFPPAKSIAQQFVEGLYTLLTTNPAILACIYTLGPACPPLAALPIDAALKAQLLTAWKAAGAVGIRNEIIRVGNAFGIDLSQFLAVPGQTTPTKETSIKITVEGLPVSVVLPATKKTDGSYSVSGNLPLIGYIAFTVRFSSCQVDISAGTLTVTPVGQSTGANKCRFSATFNGASYSVILELVGDSDRNGVRDPDQRRVPYDSKSNPFTEWVRENPIPIILGVVMLLILLKLMR
jgi:hypothetical protein